MALLGYSQGDAEMQRLRHFFVPACCTILPRAAVWWSHIHAHEF